MAESLLLAVVTRVTGKAADVLVQSVTRMWGVDADRHKLQRRLLTMQCMLADAEVKEETNPAVRRWMKELKAVAYLADDILDNIQYEGLRLEAQDGAACKIQRYFTLHSPFLFRLTVNRNLNRILKKFDELILETRMLGLVERMEVPQPLHQQVYSTLDESAEIFVRVHEKEMVVKLLLDQEDNKKVQVLPIIGMAGLGKTTLARMVYNDCRVQKHFELKMWHCVSENFRPTAILRSIIELATMEPCDLPDTIEMLRRRLQGVIGRKRFLLILDDVWNEEQQKWEAYLRPVLCTCIGGSGSMIVVTSRSRQVASTMGTIPPYELACLSEDDSWVLFSKKAFKRVQEQDEFILIGKRIVNKCKGLPLALRTLSALMSSKEQVQEWEAIAESNITNTSSDKDKVLLSILKLCYMHLSFEMKQCFSFCAIFPKGREMNKYKLIQIWIANGFIHEEGSMTLAQKGEFVFNDRYGSMDALGYDICQKVNFQEKQTLNELLLYWGRDRDYDPLYGEISDNGEEVLESLVPHDKLKVLKIHGPGEASRGSSKRNPKTTVHSAKFGDPGLAAAEVLLRCLQTFGSLAKLRRLSVEDCDTLKTLPDGMDGLTSLEGLIVEECPGIEKLPQGLLQRLPALQLLEIKACPDLQKHCSHGGEYFDLISCIPDKDIPALESKMKKFVTRLHPSC
ncbi:hypothetical protein PR202_ga21684 [Eleusine coracana subsp. coracana]|uniref:Disease resistance protein RGA3 n=1 Tax=Eleusine coracana subsp. coracana TaxID=191504 RepID=A0AAV5D1M0_ELECO|nr:hypothetical protein PR202_ga21684 [Eleusine coracana subsp. coracana]